MTGAIEAAHMGHPDFRVKGRIFATLHADDAHGMVKLTPEQQREFVDEDKSFSPESGAWGRQGCTRVRLASVDEDTLGRAVTLAWQNIAKAAKPAPRPRRRG
ncbi:MAG TPA: MmcQ/YjbR family DNA-binding protein [Vicinamibacterales bacterium]